MNVLPLPHLLDNKLGGGGGGEAIKATKEEEEGRESTTTNRWTEGGDEGISVANVFRTARPSAAYIESVTNPPRGTRGRSIRRSGSGRPKGSGPPPGSV